MYDSVLECFHWTTLRSHYVIVRDRPSKARDE